MDNEKNIAIYEKFKNEPDLLYSHLIGAKYWCNCNYHDNHCLRNSVTC